VKETVKMRWMDELRDWKWNEIGEEVEVVLFTVLRREMAH